MRAAIGTAAVLVTAALLWFALHRNRPAAMIAAGLAFVLGIGWLRPGHRVAGVPPREHP
ncbi:hypothetical protein ACFQWA_12495 [Streptomyces thermogriseus]|uniref:hypothetical protein n=1 Tax=Streptomyces thermogriseus TaxID=75292 RepID=UPI00361E4702